MAKMRALIERYEKWLMIGLVVPRPIGWVSTLGPDGVVGESGQRVQAFLVPALPFQPLGAAGP